LPTRRGVLRCGSPNHYFRRYFPRHSPTPLGCAQVYQSHNSATRITLMQEAAMSNEDAGHPRDRQRICLAEYPSFQAIVEVQGIVGVVTLHMHVHP
jgi:hypothetical protein